MFVSTPIAYPDMLEFLTDDKVKLATTSFSTSSTVYRVEPVGPINPHEPDHREKYTCSHTCRPF